MSDRIELCEPDPGAGDPVMVEASMIGALEPVQQILLDPFAFPSIRAWRERVVEAVLKAVGGDTGRLELMLPRHAGLPLQEAEGASSERGWRSGTHAALASAEAIWVAAWSGECSAELRVHRSPVRVRRFGREEALMLGMLRPALRAGVGLLGRTIASRASLVASLDAGRDPVLIYGLDGELLHRNRSMSTFGSGTPAERTVVAAGAEMARALGDEGGLARAAGDGVTRHLSTPAGYFRLHAARLTQGVMELAPVAMVTVSRERAPLPGRDAIREKFGLTRRQAEVALLLANRKSNQEIAELLFISPHTARRHTEAAMAKLRIRDRRDIGPVLRGDIARPSSPGG